MAEELTEFRKTPAEYYVNRCYNDYEEQVNAESSGEFPPEFKMSHEKCHGRLQHSGSYKSQNEGKRPWKAIFEKGPKRQSYAGNIQKERYKFPLFFLICHGRHLLLLWHIIHYLHL